MKMPDIVVDMNRGDGGDSNQSCRGFVLPCFLFLGSHSTQWLTPSEKKSKGETWKTKTLIIPGNAPQKSMFYTTHLIFCGWHDVAHVHIYCPLDLQYNVRHITQLSYRSWAKTSWKQWDGQKRSWWNSIIVLLWILFSQRCPFTQLRPCRTCSILQETLFGFRRKGGAGAKPAAWAGEIKVWRTVFWINTNTTCLDTAIMPTRVWGGNIEASAIRNQPGSR